MVEISIIILVIIICILIIIIILGLIYIETRCGQNNGPTGCTGQTGCSNFTLTDMSNVIPTDTLMCTQTTVSNYCIVPGSQADSVCSSITNCIGYILADGAWIGQRGTPYAQLVSTTPMYVDANCQGGIFFQKNT